MTGRTLALAIATLGLTACGGSAAQVTASEPAPAAVAEATPPAAIHGTWEAGQDRLILERDGTYLWEREQACGLPPCPIDQLSGTFKLRGSAIRMATVEGPPLMIGFTLSSDPRRITLKQADGTLRTLPFVE